MITREAVGAMNDCVDETLKPCIFRDERHRLKSTAAGESPSPWLLLLDDLPRSDQLSRNRTLDLLVSDQALSYSGTALIAAVAEHANKRLRKKTLRVLREQYDSSHRQVFTVRQSPGTQKPLRIGMPESLRISDQKVVIKVAKRCLVHDAALIRPVATVVEQLLTLRVAQATILVANSEENLVSDVGVYRLSGRYVDDEELVSVSVCSTTLNERRLHSDRRLAILNVGLAQLVAMTRRAVRPLDFAVVNADDDDATVSVCKADLGIGKLAGRETERLPVEPLILGDRT